ncbi:MAG: tRNA (N6-threonylcarbamoyladenosine(37)-N6)-methyltransferase TrmO [Nanoarchaeota archaeon]|nr:tRNA (N6-threonylcarbamoyladenosine(37)-N6)-methyltransferase TrmO [Nanoarchaeota archaeon]
MEKQLEFEVIGIVESEYENPKDLIFACEKGLKTETYSKIVIEDKYKEGLKGLEEFSHMFVMFHLDKATKMEIVTHPGPPDIDLPRVGVFASRSQYRPNHIALRLVKIEKVENGVVFVKGLDAINGTKILDIKPYVPGFDRPGEFKVASWYTWFDK